MMMNSLYSADEGDVSQGTVSLLDISVSDDEDTRKCKAHEVARKNDTDFAAWKDKVIMWQDDMGLQERDNVVNDYADGKRKPKNPDFFGPPVSYMEERGVFKPLPSTMNPLGLCHFYPCRSNNHTYAYTSEATGQGGPYQEFAYSHQDTASSVYHCCVHRWHNHCVGVIAGTAYSECACSYSYLPA